VLDGWHFSATVLVATGPSQCRSRRGKGTQAPSPDMSMDNEDESADGTNVVVYLNEDMFTARYEYSKYLS
jgi:hypothetical protein